ncbi:hypothetical protein ACQPVP_00735 [Clostridium nigeriense]
MELNFILSKNELKKLLKRNLNAKHFIGIVFMDFMILIIIFLLEHYFMMI